MAEIRKNRKYKMVEERRAGFKLLALLGNCHNRISPTACNQLKATLR